MDVWARRFLIVYFSDDGPEPSVGTVSDLADILCHYDYGYGDSPKPPVPYRLDDAGTPVPLKMVVVRPPFGGDDMSHRTVTVTWPDGSSAGASYSVDGRA